MQRRGWMVLILAAGLAGFLIGSIPFGYLLTQWAGHGDVRDAGSGGVGATNALRVAGYGIAACVLVCDILKGIISVALGAILAGEAVTDAGEAERAAAFAVVLGHIFCPWLGFRGGKGVATGFGVIFILCWPAGLAAGAVWLLAATSTRTSSLASLAAFLTLPAWLWAGAIFNITPPGVTSLSLLLVILIVWAHRENIARLRSGQEPRIFASDKTAPRTKSANDD